MGHNEVSGVVHGAMLQAGQVHGDVTFNYLPTGSGGDTVPDQVPFYAGTFVNRRDDLATIDRWGASGAEGPPFAGVLSGLPGVGKTSTVRYWAQLQRNRFPEGQLYVDFAELRARAGGDASEAVAMCLRGLGVADEFIPASFQERAALYRTRSAQRRLLVVAENVTQLAQVSELIPKGRGSGLLATSVGRLAVLPGSGVRSRPLAPLDGAAGAELLATLVDDERCATEPCATEQLVELCGGLPVALQIAAARLAGRQELSVPELVAELRDEQGRLASLSVRSSEGRVSVSAVLAVAYRDLPPEAAKAYRLLGLVPGPAFDAATAAAALGVDVPTAADRLEQLHCAGLLGPMPDNRYCFHDLVRIHARECAEAEEPEKGRREVVLRVTVRYLALTALADRAVREDRLRVAALDGQLAGVQSPFDGDEQERKRKALAWMEAERPAVMAVMREARLRGFDSLVWPLAEAFTAFFLHSRYLNDWRETLELGADAAAGCEEAEGEARLCALLSRPLMDLGEYEHARTRLEEAVAAAASTGHLALQASVQEFFGRYWDRFDAESAVTAYEESRKLNHQAGEPRGAAIALYFLGRTRSAAGDHRKGLEALVLARRELLELPCPDRRMAARAQAAGGLAHRELGELAAARQALLDAADALREEAATSYEADARVELARTPGAEGTVRQEAAEQLTRALEVYTEGGNPAADSVREMLARLEEDD